jgi:Ca2+-binding EF-hand superfamily protein/diadenosine tetraphosphatase ApaH/serine/threonine PP2A family protein phosphatase
MTTQTKNRLVLSDWQQAWNVLDNDEEKQTLKQDQDLSKMKKIALQNLDNVQVSSELKEKRGNAKIELEKSRKKLSDTYPGPKLEKDTDAITFEYVDSMRSSFSKGIVLPYIHANVIINKILSHFKNNCSAMNIVNSEPDGRVIVVGDIHGQYFDLISVLDITGMPSAKNKIIFNGDLVDRGPHGPEVLFLVYCLILAYPQFVFIDRGNHEIRRMNEKYAFEEQIIKSYDLNLFDKIIDTFDWLPLTTLIDDKVLALHGGLFQYENVTIEELKNLNCERGKNPKRRKKLTKRSELLVDNLLWSDPDPSVKNWKENVRGAGILFGDENVKNFVEKNKLLYVVRSHQLVENGYDVSFDGKLITIFSASFYTGVNKNKGAVCILEHGKLETPKFETFSASFSLSEEDLIKECAKQTLSQIYERIFQYRTILAQEFSRVAVEGKITVKHWGDIMSKVLEISLNWDVVVNYLAKVDKKGRINYTDFLSRYSINLKPDIYNQIRDSIVDKIFESKMELSHAFASYDANKDGRVSFDEFMEAIKKYNLGLSNDQLYDFMSSLDSDKDGFVDYNEFKERFSVELEMKNSGGEQKWLNDIIVELALKIKKSGRALASVFRTYDKDKNNRMSFQEFSYMMQREFNADKFSEDELKTVFGKIDANNSNFISYVEFKDAFTVVDKSEDKTWQVTIMQKICDAIRKSKTQLKSLYLTIDADKSGRIELNEFKVGLDAMNISLDKPLTEEQVRAIYVSIDKDADGTIDFNEFLSAFSVVLTNTDGLQTLE